MKIIIAVVLFVAVIDINDTSRLGRVRRQDYDSEEVEGCVNEWQSCFFQSPLLSERAEDTNLLFAVRSVSLQESCSELKQYLACSLRSVESCSDALHKEQRNFVTLETLRETLCGEERKTIEKVLPCITSKAVVAEMSQCNDVHLTYTECDAPGFWTCIEFAVTEGCGSEAGSFLSRIGNQLRALDLGCPDS